MKPFKKFMNMIPAPVKRVAGPVIAVDSGLEIFGQGKENSLVNKGVDYLAKQNNKVSFLPKAGGDPNTDLGKKLGDKIVSIFKTKKRNLPAGQTSVRQSGVNDSRRKMK